MKRLLMFFAAIGLVMVGCAKIDAMVFPGQETEAYDFTDSEAVDFQLNGTYEINLDSVQLFSVFSVIDSEDTGASVYCALIGDSTQLSSSDTVIVYAHGQSGNMENYWNRQSLLANVGGKYNYPVLAFDYRGFGMSTGTPTEAGMYADAKAVLAWLQAKNVVSENVVFYGFSLGSAPATYSAAYNSTYKPGKLIIESAMGSAQNLAEESLLINFQSDFISTLELNNIDYIKDVNQPFCMLHGTADDYLPVTNGQAIYNNYAGSYGVKYEVEGAEHGGENGVPQTLGQANYIEIIEAFIRH